MLVWLFNSIFFAIDDFMIDIHSNTPRGSAEFERKPQTIELNIGAVIRSIERSIDRWFDLPLNGGIARWLDRLMAPSIGRSIARSLSGSIGRTLIREPSTNH